MRRPFAPPPDIFEPEEQRPASNVLSFADFARRADERRQKLLEQPFRATRTKIAEARCEMDLMSDQRDWSRARGEHLVALYCWCHEQVYGVEPALPVKAWQEGARLAVEFAARHFQGDLERVVDFMRWTWKREKEREEWRRSHNRDGGRIGLRLQFGDALMPDYKLHLHRRAR